MALHIPPGHWQCKLRWELTGDREEMICTIGVRGNEGGDRDIVDVAHAVFNAWEGAWAASTLSGNYTLMGCDAAEGSTTGEGLVGSWDERIGGNGGFAPVTSNCAILVKKRTAKGGRANVGRMFLPAGYISEAGSSPTGEIAPSDVNSFDANMRQFWDNLRDPTTAAGQPIADFQPCLFHNDASKDPTDITSFTVDRILATQRQRMRR